MTNPLGQAIQIFVLGVLLLAGAAFWFFVMTESDKSSMAIVVCLAGAVGGVANNFRRLQKLSLPEWQQRDLMSRRLVTLQIYVSPLIGALFAFVLYGAFAAGILQGSLFPEFKESPEGFKGLKAYADAMIPATNPDAAKSMVWAFIAGFAEGFVPNFIDKISQDAEATPPGDGAPETGDAGPPAAPGI